MYRELFLQAQAVKEFAYAPYSGFKVGAALLTKNGVMYTGVNIENASYPAGLCAERAAFASAISQGEKEFEAIAVCGDADVCWPCGMCRQFMYEFAPDLTVVTGSDPDALEIMELSELLPNGFRLEK
ncbi:MAG: cytidine deaminase [Clostridiales bacterium]|nr:cytidine deaminase [Clostridiales bacterium]